MAADRTDDGHTEGATDADVPIIATARAFPWRSMRTFAVGLVLVVPAAVSFGGSGSDAKVDRLVVTTDATRAGPRPPGDPPIVVATADDDPATFDVAPSITSSSITPSRANGDAGVATSGSDGPDTAGAGTVPPLEAPATTTPTPPPSPPDSSGPRTESPAQVAGPTPAQSLAGATRSIPTRQAAALPPAPPPPWASSTTTSASGLVTTDVGCAAGTSADALATFFAQRIGPVIGLDYQHVHPLGGDRFLWLFQDTFIDHSGAATTFTQASFAHNTAMVQDGACFTLLHRGTVTRPASFEPGTGEAVLSTWFWPMGGELVDGRLQVFWVEMHKDPGDPGPGDGLGWHPVHTWLATYSTDTLDRLDFRLAPNSGVAPIYGYVVSSDDDFTYLFGNTFEQNLTREGGYWNGPHSATQMFLARVPRSQFDAPLQYRTADGWSGDAAAAEPILQRYWVENPMQPRYLAGQWVAVAKVDGYWGERMSIDVADDPWGPWTTTEVRALSPRGDDPLMNTYHAHLMPWLHDGDLVISYSQNARDMLRDAWPHPARYRPAFTTARLFAAPEQGPDSVSDATSSTGPSSPPPDPIPTDAATTTTAAPTTTTTTTTSVAPTTTTPGPTTTSAPTTSTSSSSTTTPGTSSTSAATTSTSAAATSSSTIAPDPSATAAARPGSGVDSTG